MFWTFNLSMGILATVWARFPNIGQIFVQFSGHRLETFKSCHQGLEGGGGGGVVEQPSLT